MAKLKFIGGLLSGVAFVVTMNISCSSSSKGVQLDISKPAFEKLSDYHFFEGKLSDLKPTEGVLPYDLITPLFTDYAYKARFVWMPEGKQAKFRLDRAFEFPTEAVLIKNFYYQNDENDLSKGRRIIETRLLVKKEKGWDALTYVWNDEQSEAYLKVVGGSTAVKWVNADGQEQSINYEIPNKNQCKGCHEYDGKLDPIGPKVRNLNRVYSYLDGDVNQLTRWVEEGYLTGLEQKESLPKVADWDDEASGTLHQRAMAYLDINCGHCHNPHGPGGTSGLNLTYFQEVGPALGICKSPVSAGHGSGGNDYDIVPGAPEKSILVYRMKSTNPGAMMPEVGRTVVHDEGVKLIADWINAMEGSCEEIMH